MEARGNKFTYLPIIGIIIVVIQLCGCLTAGTHGSIKAYEYPVSKHRLEEAVKKVMAQNPKIDRDTQRNYMVDITDGKSDTIYSDYYNDGKRYFKIKIRSDAGENEFIFQFVGREIDWDSSVNSEISIAYAFDENNTGGSEGNGGVTWYKPFLKKKLIRLFEEEFIRQVDTELGVTHKDVE